MSPDFLTAKAKLDSGDVVGMPTETVYGLAARIDIPSAIEKIFSTKARPFFDPLIVHVSSIEQAKTLTSEWGNCAEVLARKFWPGPLTLVMPKSALVSSIITSGLESVGIRMPSHPIALKLISYVGCPLAAPSANKFGRTSPTSAKHVNSEFPDEAVFVLNGGDCQIGIESTVLLVKELKQGAKISILRSGSVLRSEIEAALVEGHIPFEYEESVSKKESPGHMKHHYMPSIPLVLIKSELNSVQEILVKAQSLLGSMPDMIEGVKIAKPSGAILNAVELKLSTDPTLASRELYAHLRDAATSGGDLIYFYIRDEHTGERWDGILDRLNKAASLIL